MNKIQQAVRDRELQLAQMAEDTGTNELIRFAQIIRGGEATTPSPLKAALEDMISLALYLNECDMWFGTQLSPTADERIKRAQAVLRKQL